MQPVEPTAVIHLFPEERRRLLDLLGGLAAGEWAAPTVCAGWSVQDVTAHLLGGDLAKLARGRDRFADPSFAPSGADLADWAVLVGALNEWNERWVRAARRLSPRLVRELLTVTGRALDDYWAGLDLSAPGETVSWAGSGQARPSTRVASAAAGNVCPPCPRSRMITPTPR